MKVIKRITCITLAVLIVFAGFFFLDTDLGDGSVVSAQEAFSAAKIADYRFMGDLENSLAPGSALENISDSNAFAVETIGGEPVSVLQFPARSGVRLSNVSNILADKNSYTIAVLYRFQTTTGYRKIMDFYNRSLDSGLYCYNSNLRFYSPGHQGSGNPIQPNQYVHVVLTRDAATQTVTGYVDGVFQFSFTDTSSRAVVNAGDRLIFFQDDTPTSGNEASAGAVARIQIFNRPLTSAEVASLSGYIPMVAVESISLSENELTLVEGGDPVVLAVSVEPDNATNQEVIWSSSNEDVAVVDDNGSVTPVSPGIAVITAASQETSEIYDTCTITVTAVNRPPTVYPYSFTVSEGSTYNGMVQGEDPDDDPLTYSLITGPSHGTLVFNANGAFSYTSFRQPTEGFVGSDSFTFRASDGEDESSPAEVTITITPVNDAPVAEPKSFTLTDGDVYTGAVSGTDVDGDSLTFTLLSGPSRGILAFNFDGTFEYTSVEGYAGNDSFTFRAFDGLAWSDAAEVTITIEALAPVMTPDEPEEILEEEPEEDLEQGPDEDLFENLEEEEEENITAISEDEELPQTTGPVNTGLGMLLLAVGVLARRKNKE